MPPRVDPDSNGMLDFIRDLFPICRSITGNGVRETLARMSEEVPLAIHEVASGSEVFDWTVPDEWNISDAYIAGPDGQRLIDFQENNLHVVSYSVPVDLELDLAELKPHLHTLPDQPELIPYRTTYYDREWGFCLSHRQFENLKPGKYRVHIDSQISEGNLSLGELVIPGTSEDEILIYSHLCHPSLCNDNLSGLAITVWWAKHLLSSNRKRHTYRFVWGPGTIGSITWLAQNVQSIGSIKHGLVAVLLGRPGKFNFKRSRSGNSAIDRAAEHVLRRQEGQHSIRKFDPYGYDERQFCSPGIDLPFGRLTRAPNGEYPEYHTSADNLNLISAVTLGESLRVCREIGQILDCDETYINLAPHCEPQLGRRGLYRSIGGDNPAEREHAMLWALNMSDGNHSLLDIAEQSALPIDILHDIAIELVAAGLLRKT